MIVQVAAAATAELNAAELSQEFTAERGYQPRVDLPDLAALHVTVMAKALRIAVATRAEAACEYDVDVAVQQRFTADADEAAKRAEMDALMQLVEEIGDLFFAERLTGLEEGGSAMCVATANDPIYVPEHLQELHQFTSVLTLTFRLVR